MTGGGKFGQRGLAAGDREGPAGSRFGVGGSEARLEVRGASSSARAPPEGRDPDFNFSTSVKDWETAR